MTDLITRTGTLKAQRTLVLRRLDEANARLTTARQAQTDIDAVQRTVQYVAARVQTGFGNYIGAIVTKALHHVFHDRKDDNFVVRFRERNGSTAAELLIVTKSGGEAHPYDCAGGGVWDVLAFALLCAMLVLEQPAPSRVLVMDEPFKFLHGAVWRRRALRMAYNTFVALGIQSVIVHQSDVEGVETDESLDVVSGEPGVAVYAVRKLAYQTSEIVKV